ncbi:MAG: condensation domain-containing protein, partial [Pseudomonadales bacterium]|nr:condensation domain-containing protein [Pseudomonadales bacterium]
RHETLRTVFVSEGGQPWQVIQPTTDFKINQDSVTHIPESEREEAVKRLVEKEIRTSFDLEKGPLIRAHLYKLDDNKHGLIVTMHHIITDGWSMGVFVREISALYASQRMGMKAPLPELSIQYGDFSAWQKDWLQGDELERQLSYWRTRLGNAPDQLMLPFDRPRPPLQTLNGATLDVNLTAEVASGLRKLARQFDTTLYVILMAAYNVVLSKWAKQADVCVGMPVAGRTRPEVENLIGFFVNTLVIRSQLGGNPTLAELIRQIKENVLGAQSHQDLPFEAIVDDLNVPRNLSFAPVYQVAFSLTSDEGTAKKATLGGLEIEPMPIELVSARLDLTLMLVDGGDSISGMLEYNTDLFDGETVSQFLKQFEHVLRLMSDDVEQKIDTVSLQTQSELKSLLALDDNVEAVLSLAPMQRDFCLDSLLEPDTLRNSIGYAVKLPFEVDRDRWQAALDQ